MSPSSRSWSAAEAAADTSGLIDGFGGWAVAELRSCEEGLDLLRQGCTTWQSFFGMVLPARCVHGGDAGSATAHAGEGLQLVDQAHPQNRAEPTGGRPSFAAFAPVFIGSRTTAIPRCGTELDRAIAVARVRGARWFELRAGNDLAHLLAERSRAPEAYRLLAPIGGWFTEGFDTPDLKEAKAL